MTALQMSILLLALLNMSAALVCPDGGTCEDRNTCCRNTAGGYGCCPLPHAECCSDHLHCCYQGTVCDLEHGTCVNKTVSLPWMSRLPAVPQVGSGLTGVVCPDSRSRCPDDATCCQLPNGSWGCCLLSSAVCCADKTHCCPEGTKCDLTHSKCVSPSQQLFPLMKKVPATRRAERPVASIICPDGVSSCPDGTTCCQLTNGSYGCCPYPQAVCCSDHMHCCPAGMQCDLEHDKCMSSEKRVPLLKKIAAVPNEVSCPDGSQCPAQTTCCQMADGSYSCCPMPDAVCCSDHLHCCPTGTRCDLTLSMCVQGPGGPSPAMKIIAAVAPEPLAPKSSGDALAPLTRFLPDNNKCDETKTCPGDYTCCKLPEEGWACCPLAQAVCCDDHIHCCPHNTVCNLQTQTCDSQSGGRPPLRWLEKVSALTSGGQDEQCDKQTSCPGGFTCCKKASGQWACCPLPQAVCCSDGEHCCPKGYKCNVAENTCEKAGGASLPWLQKVAALQEEPSQAASEVVCDNQTSCPRHTSCCFMKKTQKWGCCPIPNAVCCEDGEHCCPRGHRCDPYQHSCSKGPLVTPWFTKLSALTQPGALTDVKCDDRSSCPTGTTCCKLKTGEWGCCPLVKAVCCDDHEHCCPQGYSCNMETGTCEKKNHGALLFSVPQRSLLSSKARGPKGLVSCGGTGEFHCPEEDTCCPTSATEWACCPSPRAVCCSDQKHCCPAGFSCGLKSGGCVQDLSSWDVWFDRPVRGGL